MEVYKYRIKRSNPSIYWTVPCTGGTDFYPINTSSNCSGLTMHNSTFSQVINAVQGDMNTFPAELTACSISNPCVILNDTTTMPMFAPQPPIGNAGNPGASPFCLDIESHPYIIFNGLNLFQAGVQTFTGESYNDMISVFPMTNSSLSYPLHTQTDAKLTTQTISCFCQSPLGQNLNQIPIMLDQDFNDIGHYDIWDGNVGQKDIFSNFIVTAITSTIPGTEIQVWNSTDFGYYKSFQDSPYTIDWGECPCGSFNSFGDPCCEALQFPNLTNPTPHTYAGVGRRRITITHESPWGPTSVSQIITIPFLSYSEIVGSGAMPSSASPVIGPNGPVGVNSYFGAYPFSPLDSGTDILQYSGMSPIFEGGNNDDCFEVTGNTQSLLGAFQSYTNLSTGSLPPGYQINVDVPLMGEVLNPITNLIEGGVMGRITADTSTYTGYTISIGTNTPISFYDFNNGVTLYEAMSCGLDAFAFGAFDCVKCEIGDCTYCETKDEYIDRITFLPESISFNTQQGEWRADVNYVKGDIVFDSTWGECCCYMAVQDVTQTAATPTLVDLWAGIKPTMMFQGVWWFNGQPAEHIWEACSPQCETCPDYTHIPCQDPTNTWNSYPTSGPPGPAGVYVNGNNYFEGEFTVGQFGNCYRALSDGVHPPPSGLTNSTYWDYIGCSSWVCPAVSALTSSTVSCQLVAGTGSTITGPCTSIGYSSYDQCMDDFYAGECCEDRFICIDQYSCQGCSGITSAHPLYNDPSALDPFQGPVFQDPMDCIAWCEPPAYSCTTSTPQSSNNCCGYVSCQLDIMADGVLYDYVTLIQPIISALPMNPAPFPTFIDYMAFNYELFFTPTYDQAMCNGGTPIPPTGTIPYYTGCCDYTGWEYNCEYGCELVIAAGFTYPTKVDCEIANPQGWAGTGYPCGWTCETPCNDCIPCFTNGCGNGISGPSGEFPCNNTCSCATECWFCDCTPGSGTSMIGGGCYQWASFPANGPNYDVNGVAGCPYWPPNDGTDPFNPIPAGMPATYWGNSDCASACTCDAGWDCFVHDGGPLSGQSYGGCMFFPSIGVMTLQGAMPNNASPPTGYTSFIECCKAMGPECCNAQCEDDDIWLSSGYTQANQQGTGGLFPCHYTGNNSPDNSNATLGVVNCCSPNYIDPWGGATGLWGCFQDWGANMEYCSMVECINDLCPDPLAPVDPYGTATGVTCCAPQEDTCVCACDDYVATNGLGWTLIWNGPWYSAGNYAEFETVSYGDGNTPDCCWVCTCPTDPTGLLYDCDSSPPDDGPYANGAPNCWVSCEKLPAIDPAVPTTLPGEPCGPCSGTGVAQTYECTVDGCTTSSCVYAPPGATNISIWQTQNNCYTATTCGTPLVGVNNDQCNADCYCADPGPPLGNEATEISSCVVLQDYLNDIYSPGTGNFGIFWMGYSPFPFTYPPVAPGSVFLAFGSYNWPYPSLTDCQFQLSTGFVDCCTGTTSYLYSCDGSCNCPTVGGNPCAGGTGCYLDAMGTMTLAQCQAYCTWECNELGAAVCQFVPNSVASTIYSSAAACELANTNCECSQAPEEYWCDWAGAEIGTYDVAGSQPCQPSSFFAGQTGGYNSQAIGQGATGPADPTNNYHDAVTLGNNPTGQGFPNLGACTMMCRFCCDCAPPGTGECELCGDPIPMTCMWGAFTCPGGGASCGTNLLSGPSPGDCALNQFTNTGTYDCNEPTTEYCCHAVDGCLSYLGAYVAGSNPATSDGAGCVAFFGTNPAACTSECNFVCGDCTPPAGSCDCTFVNAPVTCNSPYPFSNMLACVTYLSTLSLLDDAGTCCKCYDCFTNSPVTWLESTDGIAWTTGSQTISLPSAGASAWVSGQPYSLGEVVTFLNTNGEECCYVCIWDTPNLPVSNPLNWTTDPYNYYSFYVNNYNNSVAVWPGGGSGNLVWMPCDTSCVGGVAVVTWDCIPGTLNDSCSNSVLGGPYTLINPSLTLTGDYDVLNMISNPTGTPNLQSTNILSLKFPYGGVVPNQTPNPCMHNGLPLMVFGAPISIHSIIYINLGMTSASYTSWNNMINDLISVNLTDASGNVVSLANTYPEICDALWASYGSMPDDWSDCIDTGLDQCTCTQDPCVCLQVNGPTGAFNNSLDCQATLNNLPCCGSWTCQTGFCDCIFVPNYIGGFTSQTECYNAANCCEVVYPEYICEQRQNPLLTIPDCECIQVAAGMGVYQGLNALYNCENDPLTCCSGYTMVDRWKCNSDCNCVIDSFGPHATLHECQTYVANNCCYTGGTWLYECVLFDDGSCNCVQTATGTHPTLHDCLIQVNTCCYTGVTRWDCKLQTNGSCMCIQAPFGFYSSQFNCENSIPATIPHPNCCEITRPDRCRVSCLGATLQTTYSPHNGTYTPTINVQIPNSGVDMGVWVVGAYNLYDMVEDPYDHCCYVLTHDGMFPPTASMVLSTYSPSQIFNNHILGLYADGSNGSVPPSSPTQADLQATQRNNPIWWPCDIHCVTTDIGYDCDNCPGTCNCISNNTASAQFQGAGALLACQSVCVQGCEDCSVTLSSSLTGPIDFEGAWTTAVLSYDINDCVTDPLDKCCYCCVEEKDRDPCNPDTPPPPWACPQGQTWMPWPICDCRGIIIGPNDDGPIEGMMRTQNTDDPDPCVQNISCAVGWHWEGPPICDCVKDRFVCPTAPGNPSLNIGVNLGSGGMWENCGVTVSNSPCGPVDPPGCNDCDVHMNSVWNVPLPLNWVQFPLMVQHFGEGWCVTDPNDSCCYCCVKRPTPVANGDDTPGNWLQDPHGSTAACGIYMTGATWDYWGTQQWTLNPGTPGAYGVTYWDWGWVSCSPGSQVPCGNPQNPKLWDCYLTSPFWNTWACVQDGIGPYSSLALCQAAPCPLPVSPCRQCCERLNKDGSYSYQKLPTNSNPCDCEHWLGVTWHQSTWANCCQPEPCQWGWTWSVVECKCLPPIMINDDGENPCVQTESCAQGWVWSWVKCECVRDGERPTKCLKCCVDNSTGTQIQLSESTIPCVCPSHTTETLCW